MGLSRAIDAAIGAISPEWGLRRIRARSRLQQARRSYHGASSTISPTLSDLYMVDGSADSMLWGALATLRARSRQLYDNSGSARAIIEGLVALVVSSGIDIEPDTGSKSDNRRLKDAWLGLLDRLDVTGHDRGNGFELMRLQFRSEMMNGESLSQIVYPQDYIADGDIPWSLLALESDQLSDEAVEQVPTNHHFRAGVELDSLWRPVAYHIQEHPGDPFALIDSPSARKQSRRIPAEHIIHTFERLRPGQNRGRPELTSVLLRMFQDDDLVRFELDAARSGSLFGVGIISGAPGEDYGSESFDETGETLEAGAAKPVLRRPGDILDFTDGEDVKIINNPRPSQNIDPFRRGIRGDFAGGCRLNQSWIDRDNSRANFSSMQAGLTQDMRLLGPVQNRFGHQFVGQVYRRVLPLLFLQAGIRSPRTGADDRRLRGYKLMPDGFPSADDGKAADAAFKRIIYGLSTWQREIQRRGENPAEVMAQLGEETQSPLIQFLLAVNSKLPESDVEDDPDSEESGDASKPEREPEESTP